jgi:hypothetical protein
MEIVFDDPKSADDLLPLQAEIPAVLRISPKVG